MSRHAAFETRRMWRVTSALALAGMLVAPPGVPVALAAPSGEQVVRGDVSFDRQGSLTVIEASDGSKVGAARLLQVERHRLYRKIKKYNIAVKN